MRVYVFVCVRACGRATNMAWRTPFPQSRIPASIENFNKASCLSGQQARIGLGTATPDARLHVTAGVSNAFGDDGTSTWLGDSGLTHLLTKERAGLSIPPPDN